MTLRKIILPILSAGLTFSGCAKISMSGVEASAWIDEDTDFTQIVVSGAMEVEISATTTMIEVSADTNVLPHIDIDNEDGILTIGYDEDANFKTAPVGTKVILPLPDRLRSIRAISATGISFCTLTASELDVVLNNTPASGSVSVEKLNLQLSSGSELAIDGSAKACKADLRGASTVRGRDGNLLDAEELTVTMIGGSEMSVNSEGSITGSLNDGSALYYSGSADCSVTAIGSTVEQL